MGFLVRKTLLVATSLAFCSFDVFLQLIAVEGEGVSGRGSWLAATD